MYAAKEVRQQLVNIKIADPNCKFRLEINAAQVLEEITTSQEKAQGLKAPSTHFVTEEAFEAEFKRKPFEEELVWETFNGAKMRGVPCHNLAK